MAKGKRSKRKKSGGGRPVVSATPEETLAALDALRLRLTEPDAGSAWGDAQRLLMKAKAETGLVTAAIVNRDLEAFDQILRILRGEAPGAQETEPELPEIATDVLREAMKAFRRRMKLMRLDHESKLGRSPLTSGKDAGFESILPPEQFPAEVWKVLARDGQLEATGRGFYKLPSERPSF